MNILTKICVVVLLVLVLFASGVFISSAVTPDNWRVLYRNQLDRAEQATTLALNTQLALRQEQFNRDSLTKELLAARSNAVKQIGTLNTELATANTGLAEKEAKLSATAADLKKSLANTEMAMGVSKIKDAQLTEVQKQLAESNKINQDLNMALNQSKGEVERYAYQVKSMAETIQQQKEYIAQLIEEKKQPATGTGVAGGETPAENPKVEGQITAVRGNTASVNIGSAKGLKEGMTLIVCRGAELVGKLKITDLDISDAGGIITDAQTPVKQGDQVTTRVK